MTKIRKASRTPARTGRTLVCTLLAACLFATTALADTAVFKGYRKSNPKEFQKAVAAYDAGAFAKAYAIWLPLAQHGDIAAMFNVGLMLRDGRGIPKNPHLALAFFTQAAEMGHLGSEVNLADMYMKGEGTKQNYTMAAKWLLVAARRGHLPSAYRLGRMFEQGLGVPKNLHTARAFYLFAAQRGYGLAATRLAILANKEHKPPGPRRAAPDSRTGKTGPGASSPEPTPRPWSLPGDAAGTSLFQLRGSLLGAGPSHLLLPSPVLKQLRPSSGSADSPGKGLPESSRPRAFESPHKP